MANSGFARSNKTEMKIKRLVSDFEGFLNYILNYWYLYEKKISNRGQVF